MMRILRVLVPGLLLVLAACGSSGSKTSSSGTTVPAATATSGAKSNNGIVVNAAQTSLGMVLVNGQGRTLYHFTKDSATSIACVDKCAVTWPPLLIPSGQQPDVGPGVTGTLSAVGRPDGTQQVAVNGQPLYLYSGDTKAGDTNGQGFGGLWFALTASGSNAGGGAAPAATSPSTKAPTPTTSGSYGGGGY